MCHLARVLLHILITVSLILFLAIIVLWCRSYRCDDVVTRERYLPGAAPPRVEWLTLESRDGSLRWRCTVAAAAHDDGRMKSKMRRRAAEAAGQTPRWSFRERYGPDMLHNPRTMGPLRWGYEEFRFYTYDVQMRAAECSYWLPALLLAAPPALAVRRAMSKAKAAHRGLCPSCGYDLRATPERCPECGAAP